MRSGFGFALTIAIALGACSRDGAVDLAAEWGCAPVEGIKAVSGENAPAFLVVGEFVETSEAPAAIADLACNLAATRKTKLFVGVLQYLGGETDAETRMRQRLDALILKGAPIVVGEIGGEDHSYSVHDRNKGEKAWASAIMKMVAGSGADHALLFVSRADAAARPIAPSGDRFAGYSPMPVYLKGGVVSLEIAANPIPGAPGPAIRIHREMQDGFHGQLALITLTRPIVALRMPEPMERPKQGFDKIDPPLVAYPEAELSSEEWADERLREAQERIQRLLDQGSIDITHDPGKEPGLLDQLIEGLPDFEAE